MAATVTPAEGKKAGPIVAPKDSHDSTAKAM